MDDSPSLALAAFRPTEPVSVVLVVEVCGLVVAVDAASHERLCREIASWNEGCISRAAKKAHAAPKKT